MIKLSTIVGIMVCAGGVLCSRPLFAASFDCQKAEHPEEKAICGDPVLSLLDSDIGYSYFYLNTQCAALTANKKIRESQREWVAATRNRFKSSPVDNAQLQWVLEQRKASLNAVLAECGREMGRALVSMGAVPAMDMRSGRAVDIEDLFTDAGADQLDDVLRNSRRQTAEPLIDKQAPDELKQVFNNCLDDKLDGPFYHFDSWQMTVLSNGDLSFDDQGCKGALPRWGDNIEFPPMVFSAAQLKPYLNAYGRSLLLGEGNVLDPGPSVEQCPASTAVKLPPAIRVSSGNEHSLLLNSDGKLWAWGRNSGGELGAGEEYIPLDKLALVGEGYVEVSAAGSSSAAIRADGTLWMWGAASMLKLDDVSASPQRGPTQIGKNFVDVELNSSAAIALQGDGSLWSWDGVQTGNTSTGQLVPKKIAADVKQSKFGPSGEIIVLKKDGSLLTVREYGPTGRHVDSWQTMGTNFSRLGDGSNEDIAFKSDGSVWVWGNLSTSGEHSASRRPSNVGQGFKKVSTLGPSRFFAALKSDGSLWGTRYRNRHGGQFERHGCGFLDAEVLEARSLGNANDVAVVGIRANGELVMWGNWDRKVRWTPDRRMFAGTPRVLGSSFARLYRTGPGWGNSATNLFAQKSDGSVWQLVNSAPNGAEEFNPAMKRVFGNQLSPVLPAAGVR